MRYTDKLIEANALERNFMLPEEKAYKKRFVQMLINKDGKWGPYKHPKYAKRLLKMNLYIVPITYDPMFTACLRFDQGAIYIGEGLLVDEKYFYQINAVIRHEIAHKLLMHQFRLMRRLGKEAHDALAGSSAFHDIFNTVADFEISNRKYTEEDKAIFRKLFVTEKYVECLVTDDIRQAWASKTITFEKMLDMVDEEIANIKKALAGQLAATEMHKFEQEVTSHNHMTATELNAIRYTDKTTKSFIWTPVEDFLKRDRVGKSMADRFKDLITESYNKLKDKPESELTALMDQIAATKVTEPANVEGDKVWWPEEKMLVMNVIKTILGNCVVKPKIHIKAGQHSKAYVDVYNKIIKKCGTPRRASNEDLDDILNGIGA